jgi:ParB family chromosome partitioning protein
MLTEIPIDQVTIGERFRTDLGDIAALAASIADVGLLHPIVVTPTYDLVVGRRRVAAYAHLGRATIPALVIDLEQLLTTEFEENVHRKNLNPSERVAIIEALAAQLTDEAKERQRQAGKQRGRGKIASGNLPEAIATQPQVRDAAAAAVGWSGRTYAKAKAVVDAARQDPDNEELQAAHRKAAGQKSGGRGKKEPGVESTPGLAEGKARDITASKVGMGWQAYERFGALIKAARLSSFRLLAMASPQLGARRKLLI